MLSINKNIKRKYYVIIAARLAIVGSADSLIEYCHSGNFSFPLLILKYMNLKIDWANFVENCKKKLFQRSAS